jgi:hypothetical protein
VKVLRTIKSRLLLGEFPHGPQLKERMVLAVIFVARRSQLIVKTTTHGTSERKSRAEAQLLQQFMFRDAEGSSTAHSSAL